MGFVTFRFLIRRYLFFAPVRLSGDASARADDPLKARKPEPLSIEARGGR